MTKKEFLEFEKEFGTEQALMELQCENNELTDYETLKEYIIENINDNNLYIWRVLQELDKNSNFDFFLYDYSLGVLDYPVGVCCYEDIEHLLEDDEEEQKND